MCMGGGKSAKVKMPKAAPLPPPTPPPPAPPPKPIAKSLVVPGTKPDSRIGDAKQDTSGQRNRNTQRPVGKGSSLSIGDSQGMNL